MTQKRISDLDFINFYIYSKLSEPFVRHKLITWGTERRRRNNDVYNLVNQPFSVTYKKDAYEAWLLIETNTAVFTVSLVGKDNVVLDNYRQMLNNIKNSFLQSHE